MIIICIYLTVNAKLFGLSTIKKIGFLENGYKSPGYIQWDSLDKFDFR